MDPTKKGFSLGIRERKDDVGRRARGLGGRRAGQRGKKVGLGK